MLDEHLNLTPARAGADAPRLPEVRIVPARSRMRLRDIASHAPVIRVLAVRDLKARYKQSLLGPVWIVFQPLALLAAFVVGFRGVANVDTGGVPYVVFALAGVTMWAYFQAAMIAGTSSILGNGALVRKTACPRFAFPIAALIACLPSFVIPFVATLFAIVIEGRVSAKLLLMPVGALWLFLVTAGIVALSSAITVRFRDLIQALPFLLQVGAFLAPVGYPLMTLDQPLRFLIAVNPLAGVIEGWRWMVVDYGDVYAPAIYMSLGIGLLVAVAGWRVFARMEVRMADVI